MRVVWAVGGSDASGTAGIQADLKTLEHCGVHGATVVTAVTAQGLAAFVGQEGVAPELIAAQIDALGAGLAPAAIKVGMLGTRAAAQVLAARLPALAVPLVVDPVLATTSGASLLDAEGVAFFVREILPHATVLTPNVPEAERLTGLALSTPADLPRAAEALLALGPDVVVLKGGHLSAGAYAHDYVATGAARFWLTANRSPGTCRGTGCAFAAAVAARLALGETPADAVVVAKAYLTRGLRAALSPEPRTPALSKPRNRATPLLGHGPWPVTASDFPWATATLAEASAAPARPAFASAGPAPLGVYPVVDRAAWLTRLAATGVTTAQLRIKDLTGSARRAEIRAAVAAGRLAGLRLFINDHWQDALAEGAYGVHLGQDDLRDADVDRLAESGIRLGISTHSYYEAAVANAWRPTYVALGPIFATTCKSMRFGPQGLARIAEWASLVAAPVVAIGGLRHEHVAAARRRGADGVAVIADILGAADPDGRARQWLAAFAGASS